MFDLISLVESEGCIPSMVSSWVSGGADDARKFFHSMRPTRRVIVFVFVCLTARILFPSGVGLKRAFLMSGAWCVTLIAGWLVALDRS